MDLTEIERIRDDAVRLQLLSAVPGQPWALSFFAPGTCRDVIRLVDALLECRRWTTQASAELERHGAVFP